MRLWRQESIPSLRWLGLSRCSSRHNSHLADRTQGADNTWYAIIQIPNRQHYVWQNTCHEMYLLNQCCCDLCDMPEDATFREGMLPSELETKKVALAPEVCRQFLLRKQYILSQLHLHSSVTAYVRMAMRSMLFIVQEVSHDGSTSLFTWFTSFFE